MKPLPESKPNNGSVSTASDAKVATARRHGSDIDKVVEFLTSSPRRRWLLFGLFLIASTLLAYQPIWHAGFIWDDDHYVTGNLALRSLKGLWQIWFVPGATPQYYPAAFTGFWVDYHLWQLNPLGYHLMNVLLQALNAILLWTVLRRLDVPGAWLAAAIFALYPVCVESVAWTSEIKNVLSGAFYLSAALIYLGFDRTRNRRLYFFALGLFVLGLMSKSVIATLPAALLVVFWWQRGKLSWKQDGLPLIPFFVVGVGAGLFTAWMEWSFVGAKGSEFNFTFIERTLIAGRAIWFYLGKLIWPVDLIFMYPRWHVSQVIWWQYLFPAMALLVTLGLWLLSRRNRGPLAAWLFFIGTLFPALGFLNVYPFRYSFVADHFQYLAMIGPLTLAVAGIDRLFRHLGNDREFWEPQFCGTLLLVLGGLTWYQCGMYANQETLWRVTLAGNPDCWMARNNLGFILTQKGEVDEAMAQFQQALQINPQDPPSWNNVGNVLLHWGKVDEAIPYFQKTLQLNPDYVEARNNLGSALLQKGKVDEAKAQFQKALQINPVSVESYGNLGNAMLQEGKVDEAIAQYQKALQINPGNPNLYNNLGNALSRQGHFEQSVAHYQAAIKLAPNNPSFLNNLAWLLATCPEARVRNGQQAVQLAERVCQLTDYEQPQLICTLAAAYAEAGRFDDAAATSERARELAQAAGQQALALQSQKLLQLFKAHQPYRERLAQ
ncbi:MAG TPA: tetratricopeptide repeat protein [Verrucomicrobiae bacterium]|nr:tetratricopeptide repeat protein [Verrucomicrobiae bacterium]